MVKFLKALRIAALALGSLLGALVVFLLVLFGYWYLRSNRAHVDTAYEGLVVVGDKAYISYYTSPINHDYAWILGMLSPSQVRMAVVDLKALQALADQTQAH